MRRAIAAVLVAGMVGSPAGGPLAAVAQQQQSAPMMTIHTNVDRVLTNVVVRDKKTGALIKGLKETDFTVSEDKKPQKITSFAYQTGDEAVTLAEKTTVTDTSTTKKKTIADIVSNDFAASP